jgi:hypothetical protein
MALAQQHRQINLLRSFNVALLDRMTAISSAYASRIFFEDSMADPTALDERTTALTYWVNTRYVAGGVGLKMPTIIQVDCYYGTGTEDSPLDRYGHLAIGVSDDVIAAWTACDGGVQIQDFSSSQSSPSATAEWFLIRNSRGQQGWPDSRRQVPARRGLIIEVLTFHVWHHQDLHPRVQVFF